LTIGTLGIAGSLVGGVIANLFSRPADGALVHSGESALFSDRALIFLFAWNHVIR